MARKRDVRLSFDRGEVSGEFLRRPDSDIFKASCTQFRNLISVRGGGAKRRPGSAQRVVTGTADGVTYRYLGRNGVVEDLYFYSGGVKIYNTSGTLLQTITTSIPWTTEIREMQITTDYDKVYVAHNDWKTQVLDYGAGGTWTRSDFAFASGVGSKSREPFHRYAARGITMTVSARTGTGITVTFSDDVATSDHVGARLRFLTYNELTITGYTSATQVTATAQDTIYPEFTLTVADSSGYKVGQVCETDLDELQCIVTDVPSGTTLDVVMFGTYDAPSTSSTNNLVGPETKSAISAVSAAATPPATSIWDESLVSDERGYAGAIDWHRNRLLMGKFKDAPNIFAASAIGAPTDYDVGSAFDNEAIVEEIGDNPNAGIRAFASAEQLIIFTDQGVFYVPEASESPLAPTTVAFLETAPEGISENIPPVVVAEGVMFIDSDAGRLMLVAPTGRVRASWQVVDLSDAAYDLISTPVALAVTNGLDARTERYAFILNNDGSIVFASYRRGEQEVAFGKWTRGFGTWKDIHGSRDDLIMVSNAGSDYRLCDLDFDSITDDEVSFTAAVSARASQEAEVVDSKEVVYSGTLNGSGDMDEYPADTGLTIGHDFAVTLEPSPALDPEIGWRRARIANWWVEVRNSGAFRVDGNPYTPYFGGDDLGNPGTTLTHAVEGHQLGWSEDPTLVITQPKGEGAELEVRAITMDVVY